MVLSCVPQSLGLRQHIRRHQGEWGRGWAAAGDLSWGSVYLSKEFLNYVCAIRSKSCAKNWEYDGDKVRHSVYPQELTEISTGHSCSQLSRSHFLLQCSGRFRPILQLVRFCLSIPAPLLPGVRPSLGFSKHPTCRILTSPLRILEYPVVTS